MAGVLIVLMPANNQTQHSVVSLNPSANNSQPTKEEINQILSGIDDLGSDSRDHPILNFEHFVGDWFGIAHNCTTTVTPPIGDGGVDVIGEDTYDGNKYAIQAKHNSIGNNVTQDSVQRLAVTI